MRIAVSRFFLGIAILVLGNMVIGQEVAPTADDATPANGEVLLAPNAAADLELASARRCMRIFLDAMDESPSDFAAAVACLNFADVDEPPSAESAETYARYLKQIIDRLAWVDYAEISDAPDAEPYVLPIDDSVPESVQNNLSPIVIAPHSDGSWRFSASTVASIPEMFDTVGSLPLLVPDASWLRQMTPLGNEVWRILGLFTAILVSLIVGKLIAFLLRASATPMERRGRELPAVALRALSGSILPLAIVIGLEIGIAFLLLNFVVEEYIDTIINILFALAVAYVAYSLVSVVDHWLKSAASRTASKLDDMLVPLVRASLKVTIIVLALVQVATIVSDKPVTSVIAGLGVGGLAIGLAAQDSIKNFFGSIMLFSDRPFEMGDRIVVDGHDGSVESVGFRSTRIRTLEGNLVTVPNGELANKTILNIGQRPNIRRILNLGITYDTPPSKVQRAVEIVRELLKDHEGMSAELPPRVFFNELNDSALNIFAILWYHPPDWWAYSAFSQQLNMDILTRFNDEGIEFAFPSQTVYLAGDAAVRVRQLDGTDV